MPELQPFIVRMKYRCAVRRRELALLHRRLRTIFNSVPVNTDHFLVEELAILQEVTVTQLS